MKKKNRNRFLALALSLVMAFAVLPVPADAVSQSEVDALTAERDKITAQRQEKQAVVDALAAQHASIVEQKAAMDERNLYTLQQIQLNSDEIAMYDEMIAEKAEELNEAERLEDEQLERYRVRVRAMEENGNYGFLTVVLKASNLGDFLTAMDDVGEIMESDKALEDQYTAARENTAQVKADYEATKTDIEAKQAELRAEQAELEKDIEEATALILSLEGDMDNKQAEIDAIQAAEDEANSQIADMVAELERLRKEAEAAAAAGGANGGGGSGGGSVSGTGSFVWPVPSCTYITSRFGLRVHPITGETKSHTGLDIGAAYGATIVAADGGTITKATVYGGYGNCVMINHGNGYVTLYGHMSSIAVSEGQSVSQGDTIGYVGSTGLSTGPHCHFEVWYNGSRIDPEQFFTGLTFSESAGV